MIPQRWRRGGGSSVIEGVTHRLYSARVYVSIHNIRSGRISQRDVEF